MYHPNQTRINQSINGEWELSGKFQKYYTKPNPNQSINNGEWKLLDRFLKYYPNQTESIDKLIHLLLNFVLLNKNQFNFRGTKLLLSIRKLY